MNASRNTSGLSDVNYVYTTMTAVTAGLSVAGGSATCALFFAFRDLRTPGRQLLLYLSFSDALLAFGNLLGIIWFLYSKSSVINNSELYCDFQSAMTIYFSQTSFSWVVIMAVCLFASVVLKKSDFTKKYMKLFHFVAWTPWAVSTLIALGLGVLGTDTTIEAASWCWIDPRTPNTIVWQFATGKFVELVAYVTTVIFYTIIKIALQKQAKIKRRLKANRNCKIDVIADANRKLTFVPLVFIVCRIWGTLRFLIGNFGNSIVDEPYITWIVPLQGIGDSAQGFANFVLYCYSTDKIRRRMLLVIRCWNKVSASDDDTDQTRTEGPSQVRSTQPEANTNKQPQSIPVKQQRNVAETVTSTLSWFPAQNLKVIDPQQSTKGEELQTPSTC